MIVVKTELSTVSSETNFPGITVLNGGIVDLKINFPLMNVSMFVSTASTF